MPPDTLCAVLPTTMLNPFSRVGEPRGGQGARKGGAAQNQGQCAWHAVSIKSSAASAMSQISEAQYFLCRASLTNITYLMRMQKVRSSSLALPSIHSHSWRVLC